MDIWDGIATLGLVLVGVGLWMVAPWLSLTVAGALLILAGVRGSVLAARADIHGGTS